LRGERYDEKADIFSASITAWEILMAQRPHEGRTATEVMIAVLRGERPRIPQGWGAQSRVHSVLQLILERGWSEEPSERPSAAEILATLQALQS